MITGPQEDSCEDRRSNGKSFSSIELCESAMSLALAPEFGVSAVFFAVRNGSSKTPEESDADFR